VKKGISGAISHLFYNSRPESGQNNLRIRTAVIMMRKSACFFFQHTFKRDNKVRSATHKEMKNFSLRLAPLHNEHGFCGD